MSSNDRNIILIVDDNPYNLQVLAEIMERSGMETAVATDGKQALEYLAEEMPDIILMDVMMPEIDGYAICRSLKENPDSCDIPIIFLTARAEMEDIIKGFEAGCVDYITKPFNAVELKMRVKTHLELKKTRDELSNTIKELKEANEIISLKNIQLGEVMEKLELSSKTDPLTGIYNRRYMMERIEEELGRFNRHKNSFSLILADIDLFKRVNDTYGHDCGDKVIINVAETLKYHLRKQDTLARWGGEEFLLLLPETGIDGAGILAERIRKEIESREFDYNGEKFSITMTFGVVEHIEARHIDSTIIKSDEALYKGKQNGRNCVVTAK